MPASSRSLPPSGQPAAPRGTSPPPGAAPSGAGPARKQAVPAARASQASPTPRALRLRRLRPEGSATGRPRSLRPDESAVSEVMGFIITFGIISMIVVLAMTSFRAGQGNAHDRVVGLHAQGTADRVASIVVEAALFGESEGSAARFSYHLDLPASFEGREYSVALVDHSAPAGVDAVRVSVPAAGIVVNANLLRAGSGASPFCAAPAAVPGGPLTVDFGDHDGDSVTAHCIFLRSAP